MILAWLFMLLTGIAMGLAFDGTDDFFVHAFVDNTNPFVGEKIAYHLRYYGENQVGIYPQYPNFSGFWIEESYELSNQIQIINNRQFFVREVVILIAPMQSGTLTIGVSGLLVTGDVFRSEKIYDAPAITVTAKPLPDGAPAGFTGAVGDFNISANFEATPLTLGTPFVFDVVIQGTGIIEKLSAPLLNLPTEWQILPQPSQYMPIALGLPLASKRFRWHIIPNQVGMQTIPSIEWHYFDPQKLSYITLATPSFALEILPNQDNETRLQSLSTVLVPQLPLKSTHGLGIEAQNAYLAGDYIGAIALYESTVAQGQPSTSLYFNLAQAYAMINDWGRAMLNYHRAYYRSPRDMAILERIIAIRTIRPDGYIPETTLSDQIINLTSTFSMNELWLFLAMILSISAIGFVIVQTNRRLRYLLVIGCFVNLCLFCLVMSRFYLETTRPLAVIIAPSVAVMNGAGDTYFIMFSLYNGMEIRILEQQGRWAKVILPDGRIGWTETDGFEHVNG